MAVTGPESTGKTELAKALAEHFGTIWVPDYSREYLNELKRPYTYIDILAIAKGQHEKEQEMLDNANRIIFCDTEFIVNKIWCDEKYGKCHSWILEMIDKHPHDLYLLCDSDLPWEDDPLRENPHDRDRLLKRYKQELESRKLPYALIRGQGTARSELAIESIKHHLTMA